MYRTERQPAWQRDLTWASAVLLAVTVAIGAILFSLAQLSSQRSGQGIAQGLLEVTLLPGAGGTAVGVKTLTQYRAGQPLMLLAGLDVYADATEIPSFTLDAAVNRAAGVLSAKLITAGQAGLLAAVENAELRRQLELALAGPIVELINADVGRELLPAGLDDGSRLADWPAQAAANPGERVQPIVGVFVTFPPRELQGASNREIGNAVVAALVAQVMQGGLDQAAGLITNDNLRTRLVRGVDTRARAQLHELFAAILSGHMSEMAARLDEAKSVLAGASSDSGGIGGLLPASSLAGLTPEQADALVVRTLAERAYEGGGELAASQLTRVDQAQRVRNVAPLLDAFGSAAHGRYLAFTYLAGVIALLLAVSVVGFSRGLKRLVNPGLAILLGAAPGAYLLERMRLWVNPEAALPAGAAVEGVPATLTGLVAYLVARLPREVITVPLRDHVALLLLGATLIVLALVVWLVRGVRPRRGGFR